MFHRKIVLFLYRNSKFHFQDKNETIFKLSVYYVCCEYLLDYKNGADNRDVKVLKWRTKIDKNWIL